MGARSILTSGATAGLRLGRGTADRVVRIAGAPLGRLTGLVAPSMRRPRPRTTTTFTPSKRRPEDTPSPASVARNIGPPRPVATAQRTKPKSAPGAKLPPPRPKAT